MKIYAVLDADGIEGGIGWYFSEAAARYSLDALAKRYPWMVKEGQVPHA